MFCYTTIDRNILYLIYFWWNHKESNYDIGATIVGYNLNQSINPETKLSFVGYARVTFANS